MRLLMTAAAAALMLAACGGPTTPAADGATATPETAAAPATPAAAGLSGPIAGKWQVTLTSAGMTVPPQEVCYEKQMTMEEAQKLQQDTGMTCTEQTYAPDGKSGHSVCSTQGMTVTSDFKVTGDFNTSYTMEMTSSLDPAPPGMTGPSVTTIKMDRLGDCAPATP